MNRHLIRTPEQALMYLTDCTLATVSHMAGLKSKNKNEFNRQISIAQSGVDWIKQFCLSELKPGRAYDVLSLPDQKVTTWVSKYNN